MPLIVNFSQNMKRVISLVLLFILTTLMYGQKTSDQLIKQGVALHDQGKYMEAISTYQQALKANPSSMSAVYEMSLSYLKMEDYTNAIKHSTQVINVGFKPLLVDAYVVKGTALAAQNKLNEAIDLFNEAIRTCGSEYLLHYNLGLCYYNNKNTNMALLSLRKAIELDNTHAGAFLLYAYSLNDAHLWIQSFYSFHFFLLLEPNTKRSNEAFKEMYGLLTNKLNENDVRLDKLDELDKRGIYNKIQKLKPQATDAVSQYNYFVAASREIFTTMNNSIPKDSQSLFWTFFVPVFGEIVESEHFETYCRYVSVAYFKESLEWWETNKKEVDDFIEWFEQGKSPDADADEYEADNGAHAQSEK